MAEDDEQLVPDDDALAQEDPADQADKGDEGLLDKLRGAAVGSEDPNIVGDVGPTDIPPGTDGEGLLVTTDEPVDHLEV